MNRSNIEILSASIIRSSGNRREGLLEKQAIAPLIWALPLAALAGGALWNAVSPAAQRSRREWKDIKRKVNSVPSATSGIPTFEAMLNEKYRYPTALTSEEAELARLASDIEDNRYDYWLFNNHQTIDDLKKPVNARLNALRGAAADYDRSLTALAKLPKKEDKGPREISRSTIGGGRKGSYDISTGDYGGFGKPRTGALHYEGGSDPVLGETVLIEQDGKVKPYYTGTAGTFASGLSDKDRDALLRLNDAKTDADKVRYMYSK